MATLRSYFMKYELFVSFQFRLSVGEQLTQSEGWVLINYAAKNMICAAFGGFLGERRGRKVRIQMRNEKGRNGNDKSEGHGLLKTWLWALPESRG